MARSSYKGGGHTLRASKTHTVLLAYEDQPLRQGLQRTLAAEGYCVVAHPSLEPFLSDTAPTAPSCLVIGVSHRDLADSARLSRLLSLSETTPVVAVATGREILDRLKTLSDGRIWGLQLPVDADSLLSAVRDAIQAGDRN